MDPSPKSTGVPLRQPLAWRSLLVPAGALVALHVLTTGRYGIFRDEYYYLACAGRLALGYVDQPPLSIWILKAWTGVFGDSIHAIRALPTLCGTMLVFLTGGIAAEMGGRRWAQFLAGLGSAVGTSGLILCGFYSMNAFDVLFWAGAFWVVIRVARTGDGLAWPWLGVVLGLGLMNKIGLLVFAGSLVVSLPFTRLRRHLIDARLWFAGLLALLGLAPYILWNLFNNWPTLEFIRNAREYKITALPLADYLSEVVLEANPATLLLWLSGLLWLLLVPRRGRFRVAGLMFVITAVVLILQKSKPYYLMPAFAVLMAAGGTAWEFWTDRRSLRWLRLVAVVVLAGGGAVMIPLAVPLLSPQKLVEYQGRLGIEPTAQEVGHGGALPQHFSDRLGWEELARTVSEIYSGLSERERARAVVVTGNYGQAGALEYWSRDHELPPVYSRHNNYWLWGPPDDSRDVVLVVGFGRQDLESAFEQVVEAGVSETPFAQESSIPVWVCRGSKRPVKEIWDEIKLFI